MYAETELDALNTELAHSTMYSESYAHAFNRRNALHSQMRTLPTPAAPAPTPDAAADAHTLLRLLLIERAAAALIEAMTNGTSEHTRCARTDLTAALLRE